MNERRLLTDRQIARRKIIAIGLIGLGVALLPTVWAIFREWIVPIYRDELGDEYAGSLYIGGIVYAVLAGLATAAGWYLVHKLLDKSKSNFVKYWIMLYLLRLCYVVGLSLTVFPFPIGMIISWLGSLLILTCMIWAVDSARKNSFDPATRQAVVFVQSVLAMQIIVGAFTSAYLSIINMEHGGAILVRDGGLIIYYLNWILPFVLFFGMVKLIRSSLFASTSEQLETFIGQSAPRTPFFSAPVCGAIASAIFCIGLTVVLTLFWNDIYNVF